MEAGENPGIGRDRLCALGSWDEEFLTTNSANGHE